MSLQYQIIPVTPFEQNCTVLWCTATRRAAIVDPGGDLPKILAVLKKNELIPEKILITHGHIDHAGGAAQLSELLSLPIIGPHEDDAFWIDGLDDQSRRFGFSGARTFVPTKWLTHGDAIEVGEEHLSVLHCPGHTPGHVVFFHAASGLLLVGDVLFKGSIGRTDFPRGNESQLIHAIHEHLWPLGDDVKFISGHGPMSTIGFERRTNPYCGD